MSAKTPSPDIELDHIGVAVPSLNDAYGFWEALGWSPDKNPELVSNQKVRVVMLPLKNGARVELLEATDEKSTIKKFIDNRGPGIHHVCFRVKDLDSKLKALKSKGIKLINETPTKGAHNCLVAFVHPSSTGGVLVELSQKMGDA